jgi:hypothetical protein
MSANTKLASFQEAFQWKNLSLRARGPFAFAALCIVGISMLLFYSYWNSWTTSLVFEMGDLYKAQKALQDQVADVRNEIATYESLAEVERKAAALGLTYNANPITALSISVGSSQAKVAQSTPRISLLTNQIARDGKPGNLPVTLNTLMAQFQEWVNTPHAIP